MSNIIKVSKTNGKPNVKISQEFDDFHFEQESEEEVLRKIIHAEYQKGFEEGKKSVEEKYKTEFENQLLVEKQKLKEVLVAVDAELKNYEEKYSGLVVALALTVSKKIIKREVELESPLLDNIKNIAHKMIGADYLLVKSNPTDTSYLKRYSNEIFNEGNFSKINYEEDERIENGGFIIESDIGTIDGQISSQLDEVKKVIENIDFTRK